MVKLRCSDYGFECSFEADGSSQNVIENFAKHTEQEHGIDYSKEVLMQFLIRKGN